MFATVKFMLRGSYFRSRKYVSVTLIILSDNCGGISASMVDKFANKVRERQTDMKLRINNLYQAWLILKEDNNGKKRTN